ncbi:hypothetical protein [Fuerstiella marisgermanici]|uniref:Uncharacterized protein n=1 Tax=Fuerstiella marisgermanici TaxID=1891926 RepID=A0A1P8WN05_9PLAN|nr:hypothetical protein [Fuerstiella marisgermanici]APZ95421.1 hypothetical protein Fuma_05079 [Fuerstiella marisgermanici]
MVDPDTEDSSTTNPYAPPARDESPSSAVELGRNEAYRVVGKLLYCRRGLERFPNICWMTGSTEGLIGVHAKQGKYLPKRAARLSVVAVLLWIIVLVQMELVKAAYVSGMIGVILAEYGLRVLFGRQYEFVVGETPIAAKNRILSRKFSVCHSVLFAAIMLPLLLLRSLDSSLILVGPIGFVVFCIVRLVKRPRAFTAIVKDHSDDTFVIHGLTKEFLEAVQRTDRY